MHAQTRTSQWQCDGDTVQAQCFCAHSCHVEGQFGTSRRAWPPPRSRQRRSQQHHLRPSSIRVGSPSRASLVGAAAPHGRRAAGRNEVIGRVLVEVLARRANTGRCRIVLAAVLAPLLIHVNTGPFIGHRPCISTCITYSLIVLLIL